MRFRDSLGLFATAEFEKANKRSRPWYADGDNIGVIFKDLRKDWLPMEVSVSHSPSLRTVQIQHFRLHVSCE